MTLAVDVLTVCRNAAATLPQTLESVRRQTHKPLRHIVLDGASTDGTVELLAACDSPALEYQSQRDGGMYDALNRGLALCRGEVVAILNADDIYADHDSLARVARAFADDPQLDAVYGDMLMFRPEAGGLRVTRRWRSGAHSSAKWSLGWHPPHTALYLRRSVYERIGGFSTELGSAADYEFMLRLFRVRGCRWAYLPQVLVLQRAGGMSNRDAAAIARSNAAVVRAWRMHGLRAPLLLVPGKLAWKATQLGLRHPLLPSPLGSA